MEICCCRDSQNVAACSTSGFCGKNNTFQLASPTDFQIVCNIPSQEVLPEGIGYTSAVVLNIKRIINHPNYLDILKDSQFKGPIGGNDISVYIVDDSNLKMNSSFIWPACLPQAEEAYVPGNRGILTGWNEPFPAYLDKSVTVQKYNDKNLVLREALFQVTPCADPAWMQSKTYYPAGTVCYTEAAWAGSVQFGISGSGLARPFRNGTEIRYSWAGPLSLSKGSDRSVVSDNNGLIEYSSNPAVFTDARCFLDWIADQYGLSPPAGYTKPPFCSESTGDRAAANNTNCLSRAIFWYHASNTPEKCLFKPGFKKCKLYTPDSDAKPLFNLNFYYCFNVKGQPSICANDCPGVDPNAVVVGGTAAVLSVAAAAAEAPSLLSPFLGAGVSLAGLGLGRVAMTNSRVGTRCPAGQCWTGRDRGCCPLVYRNGQQLCPKFC